MQALRRHLAPPALALVFALAAAPALAHPDHGAASLASGLAHPLGGLDHLLAMLAVGLFAARQPGDARWMLPTMPWLITCVTAEAPALRSIAIERSCARPQPKNGMKISSRLSTSTFGGPIRNCAKVSQAEECFHSTTCGSSGMFSSPATS